MENYWGWSMCYTHIVSIFKAKRRIQQQLEETSVLINIHLHHSFLLRIIYWFLASLTFMWDFST